MIPSLVNFDDPDFDDGLDQADTLNAGAGDDLILAKDLDDLEGTDLIDGGADTDTLRTVDDLNGALVQDGQFAGVSNMEVFDGSNDTAGDGDNLTVGDIFGNAFDQANLRDGDDSLNGTAATVALFVDAGAGNDTVRGGSGNDSIEGQAGDDQLFGNDGDDTLVADAGTDSLVGGDGDDRFRFSGDELRADDTIAGDCQASTLVPGDDDRIQLDTDPDENGFTTDVSAVLGGNVRDVEGIDILDTDPNSDGDNDSDGLPGDVYIEFLPSYTNGPIDINGSALDGSSISNPVDGETLFVDAQAVGSSVTVTGGEGDDTFLGGTAGDEFTGNGGDDQAAGNDGNDTLNGDAGDDVFRGGEGSDTIDGGADNDTLLGEGGDDSISGGTGNDLIVGGEGADELTGGTGSDTLHSSTG